MYIQGGYIQLETCLLRVAILVVQIWISACFSPCFSCTSTCERSIWPSPPHVHTLMSGWAHGSSPRHMHCSCRTPLLGPTVHTIYRRRHLLPHISSTWMWHYILIICMVILYTVHGTPLQSAASGFFCLVPRFNLCHTSIFVNQASLPVLIVMYSYRFYVCNLHGTEVYSVVSSLHIWYIIISRILSTIIRTVTTAWSYSLAVNAIRRYSPL
jgi:hypothetical protein